MKAFTKTVSKALVAAKYIKPVDKKEADRIKKRKDELEKEKVRRQKEREY